MGRHRQETHTYTSAPTSPGVHRHTRYTEDQPPQAGSPDRAHARARARARARAHGMTYVEMMTSPRGDHSQQRTHEECPRRHCSWAPEGMAHTRTLLSWEQVTARASVWVGGGAGTRARSFCMSSKGRANAKPRADYWSQLLVSAQPTNRQGRRKWLELHPRGPTNGTR